MTLWLVPSDQPRRLEAIKTRHRDVHGHDLRLQLGRLSHRFLTAGCAADNLDAPVDRGRPSPPRENPNRHRQRARGLSAPGESSRVRSTGRSGRTFDSGRAAIDSSLLFGQGSRPHQNSTRALTFLRSRPHPPKVAPLAHGLLLRSADGTARRTALTSYRSWVNLGGIFSVVDPVATTSVAAWSAARGRPAEVLWFQ
jgi:hypothetical protein